MISFTLKTISKNLQATLDAAAQEATKNIKPKIVLGAEHTVPLDPSLPKPASLFECASYLMYLSPSCSALDRTSNLLFLSNYRYILEQKMEQEKNNAPRPLMHLFVTPLEFCKDGIYYPLLDLRKFDIYVSSTERTYALTDTQRKVLKSTYILFSPYDNPSLSNLIIASSIYQQHKEPPTSPREMLRYFDSLKKQSTSSPQGPV